MTDSEELLRDLVQAAKCIWNYDKESFGVAPRYVALLALNNPNLPARLAAGGQVRPETARKLRAFIAAEVGSKDRKRRHKFLIARNIVAQ